MRYLLAQVTDETFAEIGELLMAHGVFVSEVTPDLVPDGFMQRIDALHLTTDEADRL